MDEGLSTFAALIELLFSVILHVMPESKTVAKGFPTLFALKRLFSMYESAGVA